MLPGNEFRQSQTAVTTLFIQREHNYSLAYPTPVLGKPWSVPMEFPLYQWTVATLSSVTGLPITQTARGVSALCFYLTLPALWLLLGHLSLARAHRWIVLGFALTCPLYIFYSRAFLIETMALMFSAWFLLGFANALVRRSSFWVAVANVAGVGAGLVKVTTFMLFLVPAGVLCVVWLWHRRHWNSTTSPREFWMGLMIMAAATAAPFAVTVWWIHLADAIKSLNASGAQLVSSAMSPYHFGTWEVRKSGALWLSHGRIILTNIASIPTLAIAGTVGCFAARRWRWWIFGAALIFVAAPVTFPVLYSWHEYYWVANSLFLLIAIGLCVAGLAESAAPRWLVWSVVSALHLCQLGAYFRYLYPDQRLPFAGGSGLTRLIRDISDPQDVLIIAGNDWSSVIPFFSERRALMIRTNLDRAPEYLDQAFKKISDESVPLLIVKGEMRGNQALIDQVCQRFALDSAPFLQHKDETVYISRARRQDYVRRMFNLNYNDVTFPVRSEHLVSDQPQAVGAPAAAQFFIHMKPLPVRYQVPFGLTFGFRPNGDMVFDAHAASTLWFRPEKKVDRIVVEYGIAEDAYLREGGRTDGVEFLVIEHAPDGTARTLFSRLLDPNHRVSDRGPQRAIIPVSVDPGSELELATRPGPVGDRAFDWAYWQKIELSQ